MRQGFTLIEIVLTLVIASILTVGAFRAIEALYLRSARAQILTTLSLRSQIALDQISALLYRRIPDTLIGYQPGCRALADADGTQHILEWLIFDEENLSSGNYDGFVDMAGSVPQQHRLDTNVTIDDLSGYNLIFAGSFDTGAEGIPACEGAYGWHGAESNLSYDIRRINGGDINIIDTVQPEFIYEKYYLSPGAVAVARSADVDRRADCIDNNLSSWRENNDTLLLFYGYRPWRGETFCADRNASLTHAGSVTILAEHVSAFRARYLNDTVRLSLEMNQTVRGSRSPVHLSKQKGVF